MVDNGANCHCSAILSDFSSLKTSDMGTISGIDYEVKGLGDITINVSNVEANLVTITLKDVLFVPSLRERSRGAYFRLMSARKATKADCRCSFSKDEDNLVLHGGPPIRLVRFKGLTRPR